jgi:hypothetical protein
MAKPIVSKKKPMAKRLTLLDGEKLSHEGCNFRLTNMWWLNYW